MGSVGPMNHSALCPRLGSPTWDLCPAAAKATTLIHPLVPQQTLKDSVKWALKKPTQTQILFICKGPNPKGFINIFLLSKSLKQGKNFYWDFSTFHWNCRALGDRRTLQPGACCQLKWTGGPQGSGNCSAEGQAEEAHRPPGQAPGGRAPPQPHGRRIMAVGGRVKAEVCPRQVYICGIHLLLPLLSIPLPFPSLWLPSRPDQGSRTSQFTPFEPF